MFRVLRFLIHTLFLVGIISLLVFLVIDPTVIKSILEQALYYIDTRIGQFIAVGVISVYLLIFVFSYVEKLFKKKKTIKIKGENGEIEVNLTTISNITKNFLESSDIIKVAKSTAEIRGSKLYVSSDLECYKTDNLNEKLELIKKDLSDKIYSMVGLTPKNITLKITKINDEAAIETVKTSETVDYITDVNTEDVEI